MDRGNEGRLKTGKIMRTYFMDDPDAKPTTFGFYILYKQRSSLTFCMKINNYPLLTQELHRILSTEVVTLIHFK